MFKKLEKLKQELQELKKIISLKIQDKAYNFPSSNANKTYDKGNSK
jgi:hypothetical protein